VEQFNAKAHEFKSLFNNTLDPERASELRDKMLAARHSTVRQNRHPSFADSVSPAQCNASPHRRMQAHLQLM
jgi:hypothetical protein